ncbi:FAD binding domain protein [Talaromyces proteolyticus]|uniref:FAD binding domain protein n=1 Tax=Talaromyces proteolyticus TaxID=1131652 RepID=A0AAD4KML0_9EURO|nr:FAD binding domain protein [Talaromyces proteolyticus]KAH8691967.1 FAD binding domain protein [Talaromyces proteolyticus]
MLPYIPLLVSMSLLATAQSSGNVNITEIFGPALSERAKIYSVNDSNWSTETKQRWSTWDAPSYIGAVKPVTEQDVAATVKLASRYNIAFLATGGGHGASQNFANVTNAISIDLSNFNTIDVDAENNRITIGGGVTYGELYEPLSSIGKEIPTGNARCVGVVGATIGAGVGLLQGIHGYTSDALLQVTIVTAAGIPFNASTTENSDLFWAIRGAGANFGIITSATYEIYNATNGGYAQNAFLSYPPSANGSIWNILESFDETLPPELSITIGVSYNQTIQEPSIGVNLVFWGSQEEFAQYINQFIALNPTTWTNETLPWDGLTDAAGRGTACETNLHINPYTIALNQTNARVFEGFFTDFITFSQENPTYAGDFAIERYSSQGPMSAPPERRGVYPWRETKMNIVFENLYPTNSTLDTITDGFFTQQRQHFDEFSGFPTFATYVNYAHGDEGPNVWYGENNLERLSSLKRKWDSNNLFGVAKPVPLN